MQFTNYLVLLLLHHMQILVCVCVCVLCVCLYVDLCRSKQKINEEIHFNFSIAFDL